MHYIIHIPKFYVRKPNQTHRFHLKKKFDCYGKKYIENKKKNEKLVMGIDKKNLINVRGTVENRTEKFYIFFSFVIKARNLLFAKESALHF